MEYQFEITNQPVYSDSKLIIVSNYEMTYSYEVLNTPLSDFDIEPGDIGVWRIKNKKK
jgi:hypothetical protein